MSIPMRQFMKLGSESIEDPSPTNKRIVVQETKRPANPVTKKKPVIESRHLVAKDKKLPVTRPVLPKINYGSLIQIFDEYQGYTDPSEIAGLIVDQTGYPTGGRDAQIKVLEHLLECDGGPSTIGQVLDLAMRIPDCRGTCHAGVLDKLAKQYRFELNDPNGHIDLPIVHYIDAVLTKGKKCADQCGDMKAFKDICRLEEDITVAFRNIENSINRVDASLTEGACQLLEERVANPNQRNMNELTPMDPLMRLAAYPMYPKTAGVRSVWRFFDRLEDAESFSELNECMVILLEMSENASLLYDVNPNGTLQLKEGATPAMESFAFAYAANCGEYASVMEGKAGATIREAGRNARNAVSTGARRIAKGAAVVSSGVHKVTDPMVKFISDTKEKMQKADEEERRNMIIKGGTMPKIYRWIKRGIALAIEGAIPVVNILAAVQLIHWIANDKKLDRRTKNQILKELDDEIELCNEKIDDARGDSSKEAKYKLIRIRNKLKRTSDRIRLNLKTAPIEDDIVTNPSAREKDTKEVEKLNKKAKNDDDF